jgi:DNA-binding beta-propeller fold protein YncE
VFVISSNLNPTTYTPVGPGVVTEINPTTMSVVRTFTTGGNDPQYGAFDAAGKLYVTNSGSYGSGDGSLTIINLSTNVVESTVTGFGDSPGDISIDSQGRALVSSYSIGSLVWNTVTRSFIRGPTNALCAPASSAAGAPCRGSSGGAFGLNGKIYTTVPGSPTAPAYLFAFNGTTFALTDSTAVPLYPSGLAIQKMAQ